MYLLNRHLNRVNKCKPQSIIQSEKNKWQDPNARQPGETVQQWGSRLRNKYIEVSGNNLGKIKTLRECQLIYHDLLQIDPDALPEAEADNDLESIPTEEKIAFLKALGLLREENEEVWQELGGNLLADKAKAKKFLSEYRDSFYTKQVEPPLGDIIFEESEVGDSDRPHKLKNSMSKWQAIVPSIKNPDYAFNRYVGEQKEYMEAPYMHQLMASARK